MSLATISETLQKTPASGSESEQRRMGEDTGTPAAPSPCGTMIGVGACEVSVGGDGWLMGGVGGCSGSVGGRCDIGKGGSGCARRGGSALREDIRSSCSSCCCCCCCSCTSSCAWC